MGNNGSILHNRKLLIIAFLSVIWICAFTLFHPHSAAHFVARGEANNPRIFLPFISGSDQIQYYISQIDQERLAQVTRELVEDYSPRHVAYKRIFENLQCQLDNQMWDNNNMIRASKHIFSVHESDGYPLKAEDPIKHRYKEWVDDDPDSIWFNSFNIVAEKIGSVYPHVFIDVGAHIDTRESTPGASDNAAGVAAVVEIARVLQNFPNRYSWRFISFVGEEYGFIGSRYHIQQVIQNQEDIKAGLILDGIAWSEIAPEYMNCLWDDDRPANRRISNIFNEVRTTYSIDIAWRLCSLAAGSWSDNAAYWERGYPAVVSIGGLPYDHYLHKCEDNMPNANMQNAYYTAMQNLAVLLTLDREDYIPGESLMSVVGEYIPFEGDSH